MYKTLTTTVNPPTLSPEGEQIPSVAKGFSALIDKTAAARLYHIIRAIDIDGKGYVRVNKTALISATGMSPSTINGHLRDDRFFRNVKRSRNGITVVAYHSLNKVCVALGIDKLGACIEYKLEWLGDRMTAIAYATESEVQIGQIQANWKHEGSGHGFAYKPTTVALSGTKKEIKVGADQSNSGAKIRLKSSGLNFSPTFRYFRICPEQSAPGIGQMKLASRFGRSRQTIQRRLSNKNRVRWGLDPLKRRRVIRELEPRVERKIKYYLEFDARSPYGIVRIGDRVTHVGMIKISGELPRPYELLTNVYHCNHLLLSERGVRKRLNAFLEEAT